MTSGEACELDESSVITCKSSGAGSTKAAFSVEDTADGRVTLLAGGRYCQSSDLSNEVACSYDTATDQGMFSVINSGSGLVWLKRSAHAHCRRAHAESVPPNNRRTAPR